MNVHSSLLGIYEPGPGWLFRLPVGWKYVLVLALTLPPILVGQWWLTAVFIVVTLLLLWSSGIGPPRALKIGWPLWLMLAAVLAYQVAILNPAGAVVQPGNILIAVLAARILTLTTSTPVLMDALAAGLAPLRWIRVDPRQVALAIALMIRSIPYLLGSIEDARDAARARGRDRNPVLLLTPVVVGAVAYAQRTGEALHARGLPAED
ncbi:MAG TPA: energy-coupling factor transporter transmembrane protein EcfT [Tessaracoccus flavescens]|uniref:Energy-coupling factor transporter transmembrane protein EcfT n=1 Tax=Tessaracoccus flavescens TaxID=399497 RepID=A0A921EPG7_9ACTN|nr:energy-coupling factor transporter transmembrane protein EcfT [Tessaracoccus flavescens]